METAFSSVPSYLQKASCFVNGKIFHKKESMIFGSLQVYHEVCEFS